MAAPTPSSTSARRLAHDGRHPLAARTMRDATSSTSAITLEDRSARDARLDSACPTAKPGCVLRAMRGHGLGGVVCLSSLHGSRVFHTCDSSRSPSVDRGLRRCYAVDQGTATLAHVVDNTNPDGSTRKCNPVNNFSCSASLPAFTME